MRTLKPLPGMTAQRRVVRIGGLVRGEYSLEHIVGARAGLVTQQRLGLALQPCPHLGVRSVRGT
jgi:hypothetical protein